jgi:tRNA modification GTPase
MTLALEDTIAAIATAPGGALRGMIRLSGPQAMAVVRECVADPGPRDRLLEQLRVPRSIAVTLDLGGGSQLPCDLFIWPTERSYTRQVVVEVHTLGSPPLLDIALTRLCAAGARLAGPGEFTLRAFLSGRLDLAQAEAVLGVIDAQDHRALDVALAQLAGGLSQPLNALRDSLLDLLADLEAGLDFVDEDIEFVSAADVVARLVDADESAATILGQLSSRAHRSDSFRVVLAGPPNAGKSSLFNALAGASAIVSDIAGTTRDALVAQVELGGIACELIDTAGIGESNADDAGPNAIDMISQSRSRARIADADLELWCIDAASSPEAVERHSSSTRRLVVFTKADRTDLPAPRAQSPAPLVTSSRTGQGFDELRSAIGDIAGAAMHSESSVVAGTAARCRESLRLAAVAIGNARQLAVLRSGDELVAAELRLALAELGKVVGVVYTDDILDRLFGRFCIGK